MSQSCPMVLNNFKRKRKIRKTWMSLLVTFERHIPHLIKNQCQGREQEGDL